MPEFMPDYPGPRFGDWGGGLVGGGVCLVIALLFLGLLGRDVRDANMDVPSLSPNSTPPLLPVDGDGRLVEVRHFTIDCEHATFDGKRLLAPGLPGHTPSSVELSVVFEYGSDCHELRTRASKSEGFRATAKLAPSQPSRPVTPLVIVEPHTVAWWLLGLISLFGGVAWLLARMALSTRKELLSRWQRGRPGAIEPRVVAAEDRANADPYRAVYQQRLLPEPLTPAPAFLADLRRGRTRTSALALVVLLAALVLCGRWGLAIHEHEHVWTTGELATEAAARGEIRRIALVWVEVDLDVTFVDHRGQLQREAASSTSLFIAGDDTKPPVVRYLPDDPQRVAVSWVHEQLWGELWLLCGVGILLLAAAFALWGVAKLDRRPDQVAKVFERPHEALLQLLAVNPPTAEKQQVGVAYHFQVIGSSREYTHIEGSTERSPMFLDHAGTIALALYNPLHPEFLLVLSEDLRELSGPPCSPEQLRARYLDRTRPDT